MFKITGKELPVDKGVKFDVGVTGTAEYAEKGQKSYDIGNGYSIVLAGNKGPDMNDQYSVFLALQKDGETVYMDRLDAEAIDEKYGTDLMDRNQNGISSVVDERFMNDPDGMLKFLSGATAYYKDNPTAYYTGESMPAETEAHLSKAIESMRSTLGVDHKKEMPDAVKKVMATNVENDGAEAPSESMNFEG